MKLYGLLLICVVILSGCSFNGFFRSPESLSSLSGVSGCYLDQQQVANAATGKIAIVESFLEIRQDGQDYLAEGKIVGANYHQCIITSADEGSVGSLSLQVKGQTLSYREIDPEYGVDCTLTLLFSNDTVRITDHNYHCARYIFSCGARVGLDGAELARIDC